MKCRHLTPPLIAALALMALSNSSHASNLRIVGGEKTTLAQYPYMAALVNRGSDARNAFCGASVISPTWILTAAHCLENETANNLDVITGTDNLSQTGSAQRINVKQIIMHPNYDSQSVVNDIALLELNSPTSAPAIAIASNNNPATFAEGVPVSVAGWGNRSTSGEDFPEQLHNVTVEVSNFNQCSIAYGGLENTQICAGVPQGKKDSCQGDSGGPLIARTANGAIQVGIVSFGDECGSASHPGVYTKVSEFEAFLADANANSDTSGENIVVVDNTNFVQPGTDNSDSSDSSDSSDNSDESTDTDTTPIGNNSFVEIIEDFSFDEVEVGTMGIAGFTVSNSSDSAVEITDISIPDTTLSIDYEDCTYAPLQMDESCYIDIAWQPLSEGELGSELLINASAGSATSQLSSPLEGVALAQLDIGDWFSETDTDFQTDDNSAWQQSTEDNDSQTDALMAELEYDNELYLSTEFDQGYDMLLEFEYFMGSASCVVYIDGDAVYELNGNTDEWQQASINVPANSRVSWVFENTTRRKNTVSVRLNNFRTSVASAQETEQSATKPTVTEPANAMTTGANAANLAMGDSNGGAGSSDLWFALGLIPAVWVRRRVFGLNRKKSSH